MRVCPACISPISISLCFHSQSSSSSVAHSRPQQHVQMRPVSLRCLQSVGSGRGRLLGAVRLCEASLRVGNGRLGGRLRTRCLRTRSAQQPPGSPLLPLQAARSLPQCPHSHRMYQLKKAKRLLCPGSRCPSQWRRHRPRISAGQTARLDSRAHGNQSQLRSPYLGYVGHNPPCNVT